MKKEARFRLIKHITFLENELKDYKTFESLSWEEYNNETVMSHWLTKEDENKSGETPDLLLEVNYSPVGQASRLSKRVFTAERSKRRDVERWIENIINSSVDMAKVILASEGRPLADTYKEMITRLSLISSK